MKLPRRIARELIALFVDDARMAGLVVGWITVACLLLPPLLPRPAAAPLLVAGLLAIFVGSVRQRR